MKRKLLVSLAAITLGAAFGLVTPAMAFHGGGGFGGGGFGGGGFHGGGGGFGGGMHSGGGFAGTRGGGTLLGNGGFHGGFQGSMGAGRGAAFAPAIHRFGGAPVGFRRSLAFRHDFGFRHRHFRNAAFFGGPFFYGDFYGDGCWRRVWTAGGWQWANICGDYSY